jgi:benzoate membrane transport protein
MRPYFSISNITAGFVAVMVGFTGSAIIVFQAATAAGATNAEISSWLFALGISIGIPCIGLSLYYKMPILIGWSTPGAALLATSLTGLSMSEATGAFIVAAILTIIFGVTGLFERSIKHIPRALSSAMLAGILLHFGMDAFTDMHAQFPMVCTMLLTYLFGKRYFPRYVILLVLAVGVLMADISGQLNLNHVKLAFSSPIFTMPAFSFSSLLSVGLPLFIVNMTSQNLPGIAILNASNYHPPISPLISWTGLSTLIMAPFGSYSVSLTAMTAAICASKEADYHPALRYKSTIFAGICWLMIGIFGSTVVTLFSAFPRQLILTLAGLALFSTIASSMKAALDEENQREPAIITILVTASGVTLFGVGAAFWGLIAGIIASMVLNIKPIRSYFLAAPATVEQVGNEEAERAAR